MSEFNLIPVANINALKVFTDDGLDPLLEKISSEVSGFEPDLSTATSRKEIASIAHKIAQSKTFIDKAGKDLVDEWKTKAKVVDTARKRSRDFLDALKAEVRKPLTDWEDDEARKVKEAEEKAEAEKQAEIARIEKEKQDAIDAENKRIADEQEAIRKEQAEKQAEMDKKEAEIRERERIAEQKEREAKIREEEREKAARRQELAVQTEARKLKEEADAKAEAKRKADAEVAEAERKVKEKEETRIADEKHRHKIETVIYDTIKEEVESSEVANIVLVMLTDGKIPHVIIKY